MLTPLCFIIVAHYCDLIKKVCSLSLSCNSNLERPCSLQFLYTVDIWESSRYITAFVEEHMATRIRLTWWCISTRTKDKSQN